MSTSDPVAVFGRWGGAWGTHGSARGVLSLLLLLLLFNRLRAMEEDDGDFVSFADSESEAEMMTPPHPPSLASKDSAALYHSFDSEDYEEENEEEQAVQVHHRHLAEQYVSEGDEDFDFGDDPDDDSGFGAGMLQDEGQDEDSRHSITDDATSRTSGSSGPLVFELAEEELGAGQGKRYSSIRYEPPTSQINALSFVPRVAFYRDRKYAAGFAFTVLLTLLIGMSTTAQGDNETTSKNHFLRTLSIGLFLTGGVNAAMMAIHYRVFTPQNEFLAAPFALERLRLVQPLEAGTLCLVALAMWIQGWGLLIGMIPIGVALFDHSRIATASEDLAFASVILDMASELVVMDAQLAPIIRRTWVIFLLHNAWLFSWSWIFVDVRMDVSQPTVATAFLLFSLFWTTQVARSTLSFYVTGSVCYRLALGRQDAVGKAGPILGEQGTEDGDNWSRQQQEPALDYAFRAGPDMVVESGDDAESASDVAEVQNIIFRRGLTTCFGTVCAGGLTIGPTSVLWGALESIHVLLKFASARVLRNGGALTGASQGHQALDSSDIAAASADGSDDGSRNGEATLGRRRSSMAAAPQHWVASAREKILKNVIVHANRYGWARSALRGTRFISASREAWTLIHDQGVDGVLRKDMAESILRCWSWIFGSVTALVARLLLPNTLAPEDYFLFFTTSFALGAANASLLLEPLRAAVGAIFVSYSEAPNCLEKQYPIVDHRFSRLCKEKLTRAF